MRMFACFAATVMEVVCRDRRDLLPQFCARPRAMRQLAESLLETKHIAVAEPQLDEIMAFGIDTLVRRPLQLHLCCI